MDPLSEAGTTTASSAAPRAFFQRERRLTRAEDFARVFRKPQRSADRYFTVLGRAGPTNDSRLGLAVSRKTASRAVARNRIKRVTRDSFRRATVLPPWDLVVIARAAARQADSSTLRASLKQHWQRLADCALQGS